VNLLVRRALSYGLPAVAGVGAGAAGTVALQSPPQLTRPHGVIYMNKGDTITPRFSISTDSVLKAPGGGVIVGNACGTSSVFLRNTATQVVGSSRFTVVRTADTTDVYVCDSAIPVASVQVCFIPPDTAAKYGIRGDVSPGAQQLPIVLANCDSTANLTLGSRRTPDTASVPALTSIANTKP